MAFISNSISPRKRKIVLWLLATLLLYTVLGFLVLPPIIRHFAVKELSRLLSREVSIQRVQLNPYDFSTTIRGLMIKDHDGQPFISTRWWISVIPGFAVIYTGVALSLLGDGIGDIGRAP